MAAQLRVQVPSSVASWAARPAPFSTSKHGKRVKFSGDSSVAERVAERVGPFSVLGDAVVYTADHLPLGRVWQTTVLSTTGRWIVSGLVSGCVSLSVYFTSSSSTLDEDSALVSRQ